MEARRIRLQGERGISRQTIAQGMPECSGCTCMLVCALLCTLHTRPRVQQAPGIPCSLSLRDRSSCKARAQCVARTRTCISMSSPERANLVAQMERSEIRGSADAVSDSDCAALHPGYVAWLLDNRSMRRCAGYPCGVTEILAQSRRPISTQSWVLRRSAMLTASQMPMAVSATVNASAATLASMR